MAFKEVSRVEVTEVIRRWQAGVSLRGLSRATGMSRTTLRKYLRAATDAGVRRGGPPPTEAQLTALVRLNRAGPSTAVIPSEGVLRPWAARIEAWLRREQLQLTRIQELLAQQGCRVSYTSLRRFVARCGWRPRTPSTVRMADTAPGEVAEADFGRLGLVWDPATGRRRLAWALLVVLVYSRHCFVWPLFQQRLEEVIEGLEAAWAFFGGIPRSLIVDNFPAAVVGPDPLAPRLTRGFLEYSQRRGFLADPTRPRHPKDKPHVERGVPYVRERFFKGGQFHDLADLREQARRWCLEVAGQRVHGTTRRLPLAVFQEEEHAQLLPWDGEPYAVPHWRTALVHPDHHIAYRYALYSVPASLCPPGTKVEVRGDAKLVQIYHRGSLVKVHLRQPRGGRSTDPDDYPQERIAYALRAPDRLTQRARELGPTIGVFAERLLSGPLPWAKLRQAQKLLRLGERYTPDRLEAACQRALAVDLLDVRRLERILVEALEDEATVAQGTGLLPPPPGRFARPGATFAHRLQPAPVAAGVLAAGQERML
jgi:transposase